MNLRNALIYAINIPLYYFSRIVPKDNNIWVFGAWWGKKYLDNSKYLFEHVNKNYPEIRAVWLSNDKETIDLVRSKGYEAYYTYGFKGYYYSMRSVIGIMSNGGDLNTFIPPYYLINLWHGTPLKKISYDDKFEKGPPKILKLFPFFRYVEHFDLAIASSTAEKLSLMSAFRMNLENVVVTGLPRNDVFYGASEKNNNKKIIYLPTHRDKGNSNISSLFIDKLEDINKSLSEKDVELHIKLHFCHLGTITGKNYSHIKFICDSDIEQDIYTVINKYDMLITDYSSIYFDYLLSDKPIIFAPFDYDEYISKDRELYYNYNDVTPGPKCNDWNEVLVWITKFYENPDYYSNERRSVKNRFQQYQDGKNCERVYNKIISLIKNKN
jgi:CDP-glycerol glycerophosphotransferase (TagB/SpsB family)